MFDQNLDPDADQDQEEGKVFMVIRISGSGYQDTRTSGIN
jgi:hypothetical protein